MVRAMRARRFRLAELGAPGATLSTTPPGKDRPRGVADARYRITPEAAAALPCPLCSASGGAAVLGGRVDDSKLRSSACKDPTVRAGARGP
jgi:hypothetical protein